MSSSLCVLGRFILNLYKEADMNRNILKLFGRPKPKQSINIDFHLWTQLEALYQNEPGTLEDVSLPTTHDINIHFAAEGERARKVVRRSNYRMTGKFPSFKNSRMMHWESHYEKMAFQLLEIAPFVVSYREQPATFKFSNSEGFTQTHFPDLLVELANGRKLFIEIKPDSAKEDSVLMARTSLLQDLIKQKGYRYLVIYPDQLESFYYLENAKEILWHAKLPVPFPVQQKVQHYLSSEVEVTFKSLFQMLADKEANAWIYQLIMVGLIVCDLSILLTEQSIINLNLK